MHLRPLTARAIWYGPAPLPELTQTMRLTSNDGITVEIINWTAVAGADYADVHLTTATATRRGEDHAPGSVPTSDPNTTFATFGGTTDDWYAGGSWTQAEIEAAGFGVEICYTSPGTDTKLSL